MIKLDENLRQIIETAVDDCYSDDSLDLILKRNDEIVTCIRQKLDEALEKNQNDLRYFIEAYSNLEGLLSSGNDSDTNLNIERFSQVGLSLSGFVKKGSQTKAEGVTSLCKDLKEAANHDLPLTIREKIFNDIITKHSKIDLRPSDYSVPKRVFRLNSHISKVLKQKPIDSRRILDNFTGEEDGDAERTMLEGVNRFHNDLDIDSLIADELVEFDKRAEKINAKLDELFVEMAEESSSQDEISIDGIEGFMKKVSILGDSFDYKKIRSSIRSFRQMNIDDLPDEIGLEIQKSKLSLIRQDIRNSINQFIPGLVARFRLKSIKHQKSSQYYRIVKTLNYIDDNLLLRAEGEAIHSKRLLEIKAKYLSQRVNVGDITYDQARELLISDAESLTKNAKLMIIGSFLKRDGIDFGVFRSFYGASGQKLGNVLTKKNTLIAACLIGVLYAYGGEIVAEIKKEMKEVAKTLSDSEDISDKAKDRFKKMMSKKDKKEKKKNKDEKCPPVKLSAEDIVNGVKCRAGEIDLEKAKESITDLFKSEPEPPTFKKTYKKDFSNRWVGDDLEQFKMAGEQEWLEMNDQSEVKEKEEISWSRLSESMYNVISNKYYNTISNERLLTSGVHFVRLSHLPSSHKGSAYGVQTEKDGKKWILISPKATETKEDYVATLCHENFHAYQEDNDEFVAIGEGHTEMLGKECVKDYFKADLSSGYIGAINSTLKLYKELNRKFGTKIQEIRVLEAEKKRLEKYEGFFAYRTSTAIAYFFDAFENNNLWDKWFRGEIKNNDFFSKKFFKENFFKGTKWNKQNLENLDVLILFFHNNEHFKNIMGFIDLIKDFKFNGKSFEQHIVTSNLDAWLKKYFLDSANNLSSLSPEQRERLLEMEKISSPKDPTIDDDILDDMGTKAKDTMKHKLHLSDEQIEKAIDVLRSIFYILLLIYVTILGVRASNKLKYSNEKILGFMDKLYWYVNVYNPAMITTLALFLKLDDRRGVIAIQKSLIFNHLRNLKIMGQQRELGSDKKSLTADTPTTTKLNVFSEIAGRVERNSNRIYQRNIFIPGDLERVVGSFNPLNILKFFHTKENRILIL